MIELFRQRLRADGRAAALISAGQAQAGVALSPV
jgi:hypothetical protein